MLDAAPDSCSLTMGTTNFGDDVFSNPWPFVCELYQLSQERQVVPEFELFDLGQVHALHRLLDKYGLPVRRQGALRLRHGRPRRHARHRRRPGRRRRGAARRGDPLVGHRHRAHDPRRWRSPRSSKGGHLRVGMEDVLTISRGVPVESNAQLVERAVEAGALAQRIPMTPAEARSLLGL